MGFVSAPTELPRPAPQAQRALLAAAKSAGEARLRQEVEGLRRGRDVSTQVQGGGEGGVGVGWGWAECPNQLAFLATSASSRLPFLESGRLPREGRSALSPRRRALEGS